MSFGIFQNPETNGLKRLLAVKKSLAEFEQNVEHVMKVGMKPFSAGDSSSRISNTELLGFVFMLVLFQRMHDLLPP